MAANGFFLLPTTTSMAVVTGPVLARGGQETRGGGCAASKSQKGKKGDDALNGSRACFFFSFCEWDHWIIPAVSLSVLGFFGSPFLQDRC